jgi:murein L,D-transpeptidase YcbB/YkuD
VSPHSLHSDWHLIPPEVNAVALLAATAGERRSVAATLAALWPRNTEYDALVAERARIDALHEEDSVMVPAGPLIRPGQTGERVQLLQARLLGPGEHDGHYDETLREAVVAFQHAAGLNPDGIVGQSTLEMLNANRFSWLERLDANLERWRWLPREEPDTYIRVNIPAFTLDVREHRRTAMSMNVIVGKPYRSTPVFAADMRYLVVHPFWNVPHRLAVQDKLPQLHKDAAAMAAQGFEVRTAAGTDFVPVDIMDWSQVTRGNFPYLLRQRPGPLNALGSVKLMLPNPYAVYLHDTPSRELFAKHERSFSSGCIRLSDPAALAKWLLNRDGQAQQAARFDELLAGRETLTVHLRTPVPVYIVYFTAYTDDSGAVVFRRDLYERDALIVAALRRDPEPARNAIPTNSAVPSRAVSRPA